MDGLAPFVRLEGITKRFDGRTAVDAVSLVVNEREAVALLGPSGCGKTTILRLIAGLDTPDGGVIELAGRVASRAGCLVLPPRQRAVGFVFQDLALWPHMSVTEHLRFVLDSLKLPGADQRERIDSTLALVHITELAARRPHQLSGGEQQRVAIARAIVGRPRLLLLDEPFSSLDRTLRHELRQHLAELHHRLAVTMVVVTHDIEDAQLLGQRVVHMRAGRIDTDIDGDLPGVG